MGKKHNLLIGTMLFLGALLLTLFWTAEPVSPGNPDSVVQSTPVRTLRTPVERAALLQGVQELRSRFSTFAEGENEGVNNPTDLELCSIELSHADGSPAKGNLLQLSGDGSRVNLAEAEIAAIADGLIQMPRAKLGKQLIIEVRSHATNALLATWWGEPAALIVIVVPVQQFLFGTITNEGVAVGADEWTIAVSSDTAFPGGGRFLGTGKVGLAGQFMVPISPQDSVSNFTVSVSLPWGGVCSVNCSASTALRPPGVQISLRLERVEFQVESPDGQPIGGGSVAYIPDGVPESLVAMQTRTEADGSASLLTPSVAGQYCASATGWLATVGRIDGVRNRAHRIILQPAERSRRLHCHVETLESLPIAGALVTLGASENEIFGTLALNQMRTGRDGNCDLAYVAIGTCTLSVFHPGYGYSGALHVSLPDDSFVTVRMEPTGSADVDVRVAPYCAGTQIGRLEYCLIDTQHSRSWTDWWNGPPFLVEHCPIGDIVLLVRDPTTGLNGMASLSINSGINPTISITLVPGIPILCDVFGLKVSDTNCTIRLDSSILPEDAERRMLSAALQMNGETLIYGLAVGSHRAEVRGANGELLMSSNITDGYARLDLPTLLPPPVQPLSGK